MAPTSDSASGAQPAASSTVDLGRAFVDALSRKDFAEMSATLLDPEIYRFRATNPDGTFVVEQQAYFTERDGRIDWMRVLCSGFRPQS